MQFISRTWTVTLGRSENGGKSEAAPAGADPGYRAADAGTNNIFAVSDTQLFTR